MNRILLISLILSCMATPKKIMGQGKVTISGKMTVEGTGKPPIGIITVSELGAVDYWAAGDNVGTNHHTFVQRDGSYKISVKKGATVVIYDGGNRYMPVEVPNITKTHTKDLVIKPIKGTNSYPMDKLWPFEKTIDLNKRIKLMGKIMHPDGTGIQNATIAQFDVFTAAAPGPFAHTTSAKGGIVDYEVQKGGRIYISAPGYEKVFFIASQDTVIAIKMKRVNPFNVKKWGEK